MSQSPVRCSFCNKSRAEVARLITGHIGATVAICNECVEVCNEIIAGKFDSGQPCPSCHEPVSIVEDSTSPVIATRCAACGHRWQVET